MEQALTVLQAAVNRCLCCHKKHLNRLPPVNKQTLGALGLHAAYCVCQAWLRCCSCLLDSNPQGTTLERWLLNSFYKACRDGGNPAR